MDRVRYGFRLEFKVDDYFANLIELLRKDYTCEKPLDSPEISWLFQRFEDLADGKKSQMILEELEGKLGRKLKKIKVPRREKEEVLKGVKDYSKVISRKRLDEISETAERIAKEVLVKEVFSPSTHEEFEEKFLYLDNFLERVKTAELESFEDRVRSSLEDSKNLKLLYGFPPGISLKVGERLWREKFRRLIKVLEEERSLPKIYISYKNRTYEINPKELPYLPKDFPEELEEKIAEYLADLTELNMLFEPKEDESLEIEEEIKGYVLKELPQLIHSSLFDTPKERSEKVEKLAKEILEMIPEERLKEYYKEKPKEFDRLNQRIAEDGRSLKEVLEDLGIELFLDRRLNRYLLLSDWWEGDRPKYLSKEGKAIIASVYADRWEVYDKKLFEEKVLEPLFRELEVEEEVEWVRANESVSDLGNFWRLIEGKRVHGYSEEVFRVPSWYKKKKIPDWIFGLRRYLAEEVPYDQSLEKRGKGEDMKKELLSLKVLDILKSGDRKKLELLYKAEPHLTYEILRDISSGKISSYADGGEIEWKIKERAKLAKLMVEGIKSSNINWKIILGGLGIGGMLLAAGILGARKPSPTPQETQPSPSPSNQTQPSSESPSPSNQTQPSPESPSPSNQTQPSPSNPDTLPPKIRLYYPQVITSNVSYPITINITARVVDEGPEGNVTGVSSVNLLYNDKNVSMLPLNETYYQGSLPIKEGENPFKVIAKDRAGNLASAEGLILANYTLYMEYMNWVKEKGFNESIASSLYGNSWIVRDLFKNENFTTLSRILAIATLNGTSLPKNLAYQILHQIETDRFLAPPLTNYTHLSASPTQRILLADEVFKTVEKLNITSLKRKDSIWTINNATYYGFKDLSGLEKALFFTENANITLNFPKSVGWISSKKIYAGCYGHSALADIGYFFPEIFKYPYETFYLALQVGDTIYLFQIHKINGTDYVWNKLILPYARDFRFQKLESGEFEPIGWKLRYGELARLAEKKHPRVVETACRNFYPFGELMSYDLLAYSLDRPYSTACRIGEGWELALERGVTNMQYNETLGTSKFLYIYNLLMEDIANQTERYQDSLEVFKYCVPTIAWPKSWEYWNKTADEYIASDPILALPKGYPGALCRGIPANPDFYIPEQYGPYYGKIIAAMLNIPAGTLIAPYPSGSGVFHSEPFVIDKAGNVVTFWGNGTAFLLDYTEENPNADEDYWLEHEPYIFLHVRPKLLIYFYGNNVYKVLNE